MKNHLIRKEIIEDCCPYCGCCVIKYEVIYLDDDRKSCYALETKSCTACSKVYEKIDHGRTFIRHWKEID